ncbi:helix-turn-helix transcriptional regulator [Mesorhizobium sp. BR1-1-2]|nr:helix-turn-helix transcriptional regulator [Mesorhizobium sp. BR1-1-2]MBZ9967049.1 helix-turn-helix transcriptional regulator [Mesorhizobium sp. BR1-1-2]
MTQEELPERCGLIARYTRYISAIERVDVSASVLGRIADALGMEPEALIREANGGGFAPSCTNPLRGRGASF